jgi:hypothetical protein
MATTSASGVTTGTEAKRRRRSSSLVFVEPQESLEHKSDQDALPNLNAEWVNAKGVSSSLLLRISSKYSTDKVFL